MKDDFLDNLLAAVMFLLILLLLFPLLPFFLIALLLASGAPARTIKEAPRIPRPLNPPSGGFKLRHHPHRNHDHVTVIMKKNGKKAKVWRT